MTNRFERERDVRQLRFMLSTIESYKRGNSDYPRMVEDLEELLHSLSDNGSEFERQFRAAWSVLEERYSVMLERGETQLDESATNLAGQVVERLEQLVNDEIATRQQALG